MGRFTEIISLYHYLEEKAVDYTHYHQIGNLFRDLIVELHKENKDDTAEKAQWEVDCFNFRLEEGTLTHWFSVTNEDGEVVKYPDIDRFDEKTYEYLNQRLNDTANPLLKAYYSHILWCSPQKHTKYAKIAIEAYLKLVEIYETKAQKNPDKQYGTNILRAIINAYSLAYQINNEITKARAVLKKLIVNESSSVHSVLVMRVGLIEWLLKEKRKFSKNDFEGLQDVCWQTAASMINTGNITASIINSTCDL
jgi:hypothetical protein